MDEKLDAAVKLIQRFRNNICFNLDQTSYSITLQLLNDPTQVAKRIQQDIQHLFEDVGCWVQKKSRLRGSEPEGDFAFYIVFEESLVMCINNPVLVRFSLMRYWL